MKISKNFTSNDYLDLKLNINEEKGWDKAILILKDRIESRFFEPIDLLIKFEENNKPKDNYFGFTILAISCLLIETIQGFKEGIYNHKNESEQLIKKFCSELGLNNEEQDLFYKKIRCGILHKGEVEGVLIYSHKNNEEIITTYSKDETVLERNILYMEIKKNFYKYLSKIKDNENLKNNYIKVMDGICNKVKINTKLKLG
ncbi:MAG: hypothetical protein PHV23_04100 [Candidatus Gracilibacteria bacterium]|nr:hypothetical protein [Candidatus Gracilibacteria bacterium]